MSKTDSSTCFYKTYSTERFKIETAGLSRKGIKRQLNADRFVITGLNDGVVAAVADGIGGEPGGEKASAIAVSGIESFNRISKGREINFLVSIFHKIDQHILAASKKDRGREGMGTTLTSLYITDKSAFWVHVGDTRIYLFRNKNLIQVTSDHTFAKFLLDEGEITQKQARTHYSQHILEQCMGHGEIRPETGVSSVEPNDMILMTSDGLHKFLDDFSINSILSNGSHLEPKCDQLIQEALKAKGSDDITVVLIRLS